MKYESLDRDSALGDALSDAVGGPADASVNWTQLRKAISRSAEPALTRRRQRHRSRLTIPASLAAGIALFVLVARSPYPATAIPSGTTASVAHQPIDDLLDANVSDGQFRALISGAGDADELLAIAAQDERP